MTITRTSAKQYFETNDKPTQSQFAEVFEGIVFQAGVSAQSIASQVSAQAKWEFKTDISVSGNVSAATINATGNTTLSGTLNVVGNSNLQGTTTLAGGYVGVMNGAAAAAGNVGQIVESTVLVGAAVPCSNNQVQNITSISLPAGSWNLWGNGWTAPAGGTTTTIWEVAINSTSSALPTTPNRGADNRWAGSVVGIAVGVPVQYTLDTSATSTIYLVGIPTFSGSTLSTYGYLGARRMR